MVARHTNQLPQPVDHVRGRLDIPSFFSAHLRSNTMVPKAPMASRAATRTQIRQGLNNQTIAQLG